MSGTEESRYVYINSVSYAFGFRASLSCKPFFSWLDEGHLKFCFRSRILDGILYILKL